LVPILIASGKLDEHTTISETHLLFESATEPKEFVVFPDAAHVDLLVNNQKMYEKRVLAFLDFHLQPRRLERESEEPAM
jgi:fermentation-respiration switch protein FrsA (DUF1100 family)